MKNITFTYTKKDGSVSSRNLLAMTVPTDKFAGIDISEMSPDNAAEFVVEAEAAYAEYLGAMKVIQERFDLKHNFRQFIAANMSGIEEI